MRELSAAYATAVRVTLWSSGIQIVKPRQSLDSGSGD